MLLSLFPTARDASMSARWNAPWGASVCHQAAVFPDKHETALRTLENGNNTGSR